jgi:hypothetical protein
MEDLRYAFRNTGPTAAMKIAHVGSTQTLSYNTLPRCIHKVGSFKPKYKTMEQLPSITSES